MHRTSRPSGFFDFDPLDMMPHKLTTHGMMCIQVLSRIGLRRFYLYHDMSGCEVWPGRAKRLPWYPVKPASFDPLRKFLHLHRQSFPGDLGSQLQATYLRKHGITKGRYIEAFLDRYRMPEELLVATLNQIEQETSNQLRALGVHPEPFAQEPKVLQEMLEKVRQKGRPIGPPVGPLPEGANLKWGYQDSCWPADIRHLYRRIIDRSHFPDVREFWFDGDPLPQPSDSRESWHESA